jgi:hypothetical protein
MELAIQKFLRSYHPTDAPRAAVERLGLKVSQNAQLFQFNYGPTSPSGVREAEQ